MAGSGHDLARSGAEWLREKTLHKPETVFPPSLWRAALRDCKAAGVPVGKLRHLYLTQCEFAGWHRGGVVVSRFVRDACRLEARRLDRLATLLFPTFEVVTVLEVNYIARSFRSVRVRADTAPAGEFVLSEGFPDKVRDSEGLPFKHEEHIVIAHDGIVDDLRTNVRYAGRTTDMSLLARAREHAQYELAHAGAREKAKDAIQEAKEKVDKELYSISFVRFVRWMVQFTCMSVEELARFVVSDLMGELSVQELLDLLHGDFSQSELRHLKTLVRLRFESDARGASAQDRLISFMERYPVLLTPIILIQQAFRRHTFGQRSDEGKAYPVSLRAAWAYTAQMLLQRSLDDDGISRRETTSPGARQQPKPSMRRRSSTLKIFSATARRISQSGVPSFALRQAPGARRSALAARAQECRGCSHNTYLQASQFCASCEKRGRRVLAEQGGYQFAALVLARAAGHLTPPVPDAQPEALWLEQYDRKGRSTFYFDVASGESQWMLPRNTKPAHVRLFSAEEMARAKSRSTPEWMCAPGRHS